MLIRTAEQSAGVLEISDSNAGIQNLKKRCGVVGWEGEFGDGLDVLLAREMYKFGNLIGEEVSKFASAEDVWICDGV